MEACNAGLDTDCPFTDGVGGSGVYFSFDAGDTWVQPTYAGYSARNCLGGSGVYFSFDAGDTWVQPTYAGYSARNCLGVAGLDDPCIPNPSGPIGTLPDYYENGLVSDGDPALAFGPKPDENGEFAWSNGSRLYYVNLVSAFPGSGALKGFEGLAVSRTDDVATAATGSSAAWMDPVILSKQASATFSDKEQVWVDNASSSPHLGNVYVCYAKFQGNGAAPMVVAVSRDGGATWANKNVSPAHAVAPSRWGQSGCTIRTDSKGVVLPSGSSSPTPTSSSRRLGSTTW